MRISWNDLPAVKQKAETVAYSKQKKLATTTATQQHHVTVNPIPRFRKSTVAK
jgi:hypothetical protein